MRDDCPAKAFLPEDTCPAYTPKTWCANTTWPRQLTWQCRMGLSSILISTLGWKSTWTCTGRSEAANKPFCGWTVKWDAKSGILVSAVSSVKLGRKGKNEVSAVKSTSAISTARTWHRAIKNIKVKESSSAWGILDLDRECRQSQVLQAKLDPKFLHFLL